ncbi:MAG: hypothetical protein ACYS8X_08280 [Planctomycetota bacterium]|jgi:MFS family permease
MAFRKKSYNALPALAVRGPTLRWALRRVTVAWMIGVVWLVASTGAHMDKFTRMVGFDDFTRGLLSSLPYAGAIFLLLATVLIERTGLTKYQFLLFAVIHRAMWFGVAAVILVVPTPSQVAVWAIVVLVLLSYCADAMASPAWMTWMGWLIPPRIRGRYMGQRRRWTTGVQLTAAMTIASAAWLAEVDAPLTVADQPALAAVLVGALMLGGVCGVIDILLFIRIPEVLPPKLTSHSTPRRSFVATMRYLLVDPMRDSQFRGYVLFGSTIALAMAVSTSYFHWNIMENLKLSVVYASSQTVIFATTWMVLAGAIGRAIDKWGRRPVLIIGTMGTMTSILPWFFAYEGMPGLMWFCALGPFLGGIWWGAIQQAQINVMLRFADGDGQSRYIAASAFYLSVGGVLGGLAGGLLTRSFIVLQDNPIRLGPLLWNNWHVAFAASFMCRAVSLLFLRGMHDPGSSPTRVVTRRIGANVYSAITSGLFYPLRVFGWRRPRRAENGEIGLDNHLNGPSQPPPAT